MQRTLKLTLEYEGSRYSGWQRQPDRATVQEILEDALRSLLAERVSTVAAGRTDAGVHAHGQVVSFRTNSRIPPRGIMLGVNSRLPEDIGVIGADEAAAGFHAQRDSKGKHYLYRILNRRVPSPIAARFATHVPVPLDAERMGRAAATLLGRHDFSSFRNTGSVPGSAVRTVSRLDIGRDGDYISIDVEGDGFLYKMVRNLVGTLILVGRGKLDPGEVRAILERRDRESAGPTAPAVGLFLVEVFY